jgi:hypothetical protein
MSQRLRVQTDPENWGNTACNFQSAFLISSAPRQKDNFPVEQIFFKAHLQNAFLFLAYLQAIDSIRLE